MASITVGGWTGSTFFSSAVTPQNRTMFVQAVIDVVNQYGFDGVDFE
jgi:chitinase